MKEEHTGSDAFSLTQFSGSTSTTGNVALVQLLCVGSGRTGVQSAFGPGSEGIPSADFPFDDFRIVLFAQVSDC